MTWSGVVQSVARQPLELDILVRVQAPEPLHALPASAGELNLTSPPLPENEGNASVNHNAVEDKISQLVLS